MKLLDIKWPLNEVVTDREIMWPPMIIIMNTKLEQGNKKKLLGMGNPELLAYIESYASVKVHNSYDP